MANEAVLLSQLLSLNNSLFTMCIDFDDISDDNELHLLWKFLGIAPAEIPTKHPHRRLSTQWKRSTGEYFNHTQSVSIIEVFESLDKKLRASACADAAFASRKSLF